MSQYSWNWRAQVVMDFSTPTRSRRPPRKKKAEIVTSPYFSPGYTPGRRSAQQKSSVNAEISVSSADELPQVFSDQDPLTLFNARKTEALCTELLGLKPTLIQECLAHDPWKLLAAVTLLNVTSGKSAIPVYWKVLERWPTPFDLSQAEESDVVQLLGGLGLQNVRAKRLIEMSRLYLLDPPSVYDPRPSRVYISVPGASPLPRSRKRNKEPLYPPTPISHLPGAGLYALDSYRIFCTSPSEWRDVLPRDKELIRYLKWKWAVEERRVWSPTRGPGALVTAPYLRSLITELGSGSLTAPQTLPGTSTPRGRSGRQTATVPNCGSPIRLKEI